MAFQIRRAHRFLPPPQDQITLTTSTGTNREKVPGTFSLSHHFSSRSLTSYRRNPIQYMRMLIRVGTHPLCLVMSRKWLECFGQGTTRYSIEP